MQAMDVDDPLVQEAMAWATGKAVMSWFNPVDGRGHIHPVAIQTAVPGENGGAPWEFDFSETRRLARHP